MGYTFSFGILLLIYLVVGYIMGERFLKEVENEEDTVFQKRHSNNINMMLSNRRLTLIMYSLFWLPMFVYLQVSYLSNFAKKKLSILEKEWDIMADEIDVESLKEDFTCHLIGATVKLSSDASPLLEDDLITINLNPGEQMMIETISIKEVEYEYDQAEESENQSSDVLANQPIIVTGIELKLNGYSFMCEGTSLIISKRKLFGRTYLRFEAELDDDWQEVTFEIL